MSVPALTFAPGIAWAILVYANPSTSLRDPGMRRSVVHLDAQGCCAFGRAGLLSMSKYPCGHFLGDHPFTIRGPFDFAQGSLAKALLFRCRYLP